MDNPPSGCLKWRTKITTSSSVLFTVENETKLVQKHVRMKNLQPFTDPDWCSKLVTVLHTYFSKCSLFKPLFSMEGRIKYLYLARIIDQRKTSRGIGFALSLRSFPWTRTFKSGPYRTLVSRYTFKFLSCHLLRRRATDILHVFRANINIGIASTSNCMPSFRVYT